MCLKVTQGSHFGYNKKQLTELRKAGLGSMGLKFALHFQTDTLICSNFKNIFMLKTKQNTLTQILTRYTLLGQPEAIYLWLRKDVDSIYTF